MAARVQPPPLHDDGVYSDVELRMACSGIIDLDQGQGKSDPQCIVFCQRGRGPFVEIGRTEIVDDVEDVEWTTAVNFRYHFEERQILRFIVIDVDGPGRWEDQDQVGTFEVKAAELMTARGNVVAANLTNPKLMTSGPPGVIRVMAEEVQASHESMYLQFAAKIAGGESGAHTQATRGSLTVHIRNAELFLAEKHNFLQQHPSAFVTVFCDGKQVFKSKTVNNSRTPAWSETFVVQCTSKSLLTFKVFDHHRLHADVELMSLDQKVESLNPGDNEIALESDRQKLFVKCIPGGDLALMQDPVLVISRSRGENDWTPVHQTEVLFNNNDPTWKPFELAMLALCNGDLARPIKIECFDYDDPEHRTLLGELLTNAAELSTGDLVRNLVHPKTGKVGGKLMLKQYEMRTQPTLAEYLAGGCQISLSLAIDYTASNGIATDPSSLHYNNPPQLNQYQQAILSVGEIVVPYDSDKQVPVMGFGAKVPYGSMPSHCFFLNPQGVPVEEEVECYDVAGMLQAYNQSFAHVKLHGPTNFAPVIQRAAAMASQHVSQEDQRYYVLLILTDGEITDMEKTKNAIIDASVLPLSIIIVGVGYGCDFEMMDELDGDDGLLRAGSRTAQRDIVQFVRFKDYGMDRASELAAAVLEEIPGQLVSFFKSKGITPNPPPVVTDWVHAPAPPYDAVAAAPPQYPPQYPPPAY